ncbi:MAG: LysR family transcriptional regulator [Burkholderiales bacterium]|nr:LysR family transcriptional regulator [Burkholderiales bacterium]
MKLNQLALFVAIAEEGQIGRAAARAGISQPALTKQLKNLEQSVGSPLFERNRSGVLLTQAGTLLLARARGILCSAGEAQRELAELSTGAIGRLRIGAGPTMAEYLLPQVVGGLLSRFPGIELRVMSALNDVLFENLRAGELDLVVSAIPETAPEDFEQELLLHDELVVVANTAHPLLHRNRVRLQDLTDESWVLPPPRVLARQWLNQQFGNRRLSPPRAAVEADSESSVLAIVSSTSLLGFQPRSHTLASTTRTRIAELHVPELCWRRPIGVSWRKGAYLPQASRHFTASLREIAARSSGLVSRPLAARKRKSGPTAQD